MNFYGVNYLENRGTINDVIKYIIIFAILIIFIFFLFVTYALAYKQNIVI